MSAIAREAQAPASADQALSALAAREVQSAERPRLRPDLLIRRLVQLGEVSWALRNPETNKIYIYDEATWELVKLFDGTRTRREILAEYNGAFAEGQGIPFQHVLDLEENLREIRVLVVSQRERSLDLLQGLQKARRRVADKNAEGVDPMYMTFHVVDPNRFLDRTQKYVRWLWTPPAVVVSCVLFVLTLAVYVDHWDTIWRQTLETYAFYEKPFLQVLQFFAVFVSIGVFHELSHAYVTKFYGGEVHSIGVAFLYFAPAMFADCSDSILFEDRWQRLWVSLAGIYVEAWMTVLATALWLASYPDTALHDFAYKAMLYAGVSTVFFNINPLVKIDGYYAMTDYLGLPTLREDAFAYLGASLQKHVLRLDVRIEPLSRKRRRLLVTYGVLAALWAGFIMWFFGHLLLNFFGKVLPEFALPLAVLALLQIFRKRVIAVWRVAKLFYLDKKELLMSRRMHVPLGVAACGVLLALVVPWSHRTVESPVVLRPVLLARLDAPADGIVADVRVREGAPVREGDVVLSLSSLAAESRIASLSADSARLAGEAQGRRTAGDAPGTLRSEAEAGAVNASLRAERSGYELLTLRSPMAGTVLTDRLQDLEGRFVRAGSLLAEVGDSRRLVAEIAVSERLLSDVAPGQEVSILLARKPFPLLRGRVVSVAPAARAEARARTASDPLRPPEMPEPFVARAEFENLGGSLKPGSDGIARIETARASILARGFRILYRWVRTVAW